MLYPGVVPIFVALAQNVSLPILHTVLALIIQKNGIQTAKHPVVRCHVNVKFEDKVLT